IGSPVAKCTDSSLDVYRICSCAKTFLFCVQSELRLVYTITGRRYHKKRWWAVLTCALRADQFRQATSQEVSGQLNLRSSIESSQICSVSNTIPNFGSLC